MQANARPARTLEALLVVMIALLPREKIAVPPYPRLSMRIANIFDPADVSDYSVEVLEAANPFAGTPPREDLDCRIERHDRRQSIWKVLARAATEAEAAEYLDLQEGIGACGN
jgi:hypothetical protein